jgi:tRNA (guanosine-2'-O-)-methyltransferase
MSYTNSDLIKYLSGFITTRRWHNMEKIIHNRTRHITVVLEDIFQPQNASAVLRTCECLGIQDVHIIENKNKYNVNPDVVMGSDKWINLIKYDQDACNTPYAINQLRKEGYRIIATSLSNKATPLNKFEPSKNRSAIFFGTELTGLTDTVLNQADEHLKIPIYGFTDSYNISVSAAIILYDLINRLHSSHIPWQLTESENEEIMLQWLKKSIKRSDLLIKEFLENQ